jgi:hypothetical protein
MKYIDYLHGLRMRGFNFLIHYNKVEVYALIFGHILFNSTLDRKTALSQPILYSVIYNVLKS